MNVIVFKEKSTASYLTGGGYAANDCQIYVDESLPLPEQRKIVLHEIIEAFFPCLSHDKVDEVTELLMSGLDKIEEHEDFEPKKPVRNRDVTRYDGQERASFDWLDRSFP